MATTSLSFSVLLTVALIPAVIHGLIQCKDSSGNDVDWYYIYKLPSPMGDSYYFLSNLNQQFAISTDTTGLTGPYNPLAQTLSQTYQLQKDLVIMYNDHPPGGSSNGKKGHTKGVVAFGGSTGFWLIHSIPRFPDKATYQWPDSARKNGQSALCITFSNNQIPAINTQLQHMDPNVYYEYDMSDLSPITIQNSDNIVTLTSNGGQQFIHYAKSSSFGKVRFTSSHGGALLTKLLFHLYSELVAKHLKKKLYVETWRRSPKLKSDCSTTYPVCNVDAVTLPHDLSFGYTKDHSKWAVTDDGNYICIGGINRMKSQFERGGGTMCVNLPVIAAQYLLMVGEVEECPNDQPQLC